MSQKNSEKNYAEENNSLCKQMMQKLGDIDAKLDHMVARQSGFKTIPDYSNHSGNYYGGNEDESN